MVALFGPSPGLEGPFLAEGGSRDSWVLVLASKVSARQSAPGMGGRAAGGAGGAGGVGGGEARRRDHPPPQFWGPARRPSF